MRRAVLASYLATGQELSRAGLQRPECACRSSCASAYSISDLAQQTLPCAGCLYRGSDWGDGRCDFTLTIPRECGLFIVGLSPPLNPGQMWIGSATPPDPPAVDAVPMSPERWRSSWVEVGWHDDSR